MKVFRFMSKLEFEKYMQEKKLKNTIQHKGKTNSKGFCFLNINEYSPEYAFHFLTGIVTPEICAVFETDFCNLNKTWGKYAMPLKNMTTEDMLKAIMGLNDIFIVNEYCTTEYSKKSFKLIRYTIPDWFNLENWEWKEYTDELQATKRIKKQNVKRDKAV